MIKGVWPNSLVRRPPWLYASFVKNKTRNDDEKILRMIPIFFRRLQENNVATDRVSMEKNLIGIELRSRISSFIVR